MAERWLTVLEAAGLMQCKYDTARRRLAPYLRKRKHRGRDCLVVQLQMVTAAMVEGRIAELTDARYEAIRDEMEELAQRHVEHVGQTEARLFRLERLNKIDSPTIRTSSGS